MCYVWLRKGKRRLNLSCGSGFWMVFRCKGRLAVSRIAAARGVRVSPQVSEGLGVLVCSSIPTRAHLPLQVLLPALLTLMGCSWSIAMGGAGCYCLLFTPLLKGELAPGGRRLYMRRTRLVDQGVILAALIFPEWRVQWAIVTCCDHFGLKSHL